MNPLGYGIGALVLLLITTGWFLKIEVAENGALNQEIKTIQARHAEALKAERAKVQQWQDYTKAAEQKVVALNAAVERLQKAADDGRRMQALSESRLRDELARLRASDPKNCIFQPVYPAVDRRLRDALRLPQPGPAGDGAGADSVEPAAPRAAAGLP